MELIDTNAELEASCRHLSSADVLTVDTEFIRENTYYPRLCLVQLASDDHVVAVDPLGLDVRGQFDVIRVPASEPMPTAD